MALQTSEEILCKVRQERKEWMSEDTWKLVEERYKMKGKMEAAKTRNQKLDSAHVYNMNKEVKRSCRRDTRKRIYNIAREAEDAAEKRDVKELYDTIWLLSGKRTVQNSPVKDRKGVDLTRTDDQLNRWKEHFQEILNRPAPKNLPDLTEGPALAI